MEVPLWVHAFRVLVAFALYPLVLPGARRTRLLWSAAVAATALVPLFAWTLHNGVRFDEWKLARGGNAVVPFYRAFLTDRIVSPEHGSASRRLDRAIRRSLLTREPYRSYRVTPEQVYSAGSARVHEDLYLLSDEVFGWDTDYAVLRDAARAATRTNGLPLIPTRTLKFTTDEGTWISLDVSPDGQTIAATLEGATYDVWRVDVERDLLKKAMAKAGHNKSKAAKLLGLSRGQLYSLLRRHGLTEARRGDEMFGVERPRTSEEEPKRFTRAEFDAHGHDVSIQGWTESGGADLVALARRFSESEVAALVVTENIRPVPERERGQEPQNQLVRALSERDHAVALSQQPRVASPDAIGHRLGPLPFVVHELGRVRPRLDRSLERLDEP